ncbi:FYVE zinc finger [Ancylostoma caninum]|uniref:FYVE zinc finger n=1 Tax=Ancylostoma caninum TaxID=29170 RepID=A0A368H2C3_ANCCA|nr:FYVE zinc finger [Ancylostoma caninum]
MSAVINSRPTSSASANSIGEEAKPALLHKIEGHVARVNDVVLLSKEEGVWTASDDRSVRLYLKRDNGQFWPSIHKIMPVAPTCLYYSEETSRLLVGLLNGHVYEYHVADDYNSMSDPEARRWTIHAGPISGLGIALNAELVFSCSKDKSVVWHCSETGIKRGAFHCDSSCTAMVIDLPFVFIGDHGGNVVVLRLSGDSAQMVSKLSAHTGPVSSLAWNRMKEILYSGSHDNLVIMWDIGGKRGEAYELNGHSSKITSLVVAPGAARLFSADDAGKLVCWDMSAHRLETPGWKTSDNCEVCDAPFFWNLTAMWQRKVVGQRQHHCRTCGKAVCGACCSNWTVFPRMGYELPVRICSVCHQKMEENPQQFDLTPLAVSHDIRSGVTAMHLQETLGKLVTASQNRVIMIWDVRSML